MDPVLPALSPRLLQFVFLSSSLYTYVLLESQLQKQVGTLPFGKTQACVLIFSCLHFIYGSAFEQD